MSGGFYNITDNSNSTSDDFNLIHIAYYDEEPNQYKGFEVTLNVNVEKKKYGKNKVFYSGNLIQDFQNAYKYAKSKNKLVNILSAEIDSFLGETKFFYFDKKNFTFVRNS